MKDLFFLRQCECKHTPIDLNEAVAETQRIVNETQKMVKALKEAVAETQQIVNETQQMVKPLYEAHKCEDGKMHCRNDNQCGANGKCIWKTV